MDFNNINIKQENILEDFNAMYNNVKDKSLIEINIEDFENNAVLITIDMINGFAREGALYSKNTENTIKNIVSLAKSFELRKLPIITYNDAHTASSPEFRSFPQHALKGSMESELIDELKEIKDIRIVNKNSTNGFLVENPFESLNKKYDNFIVVGCCTDLCIYQFALTLKAYFNEINHNGRVILPINTLSTFDMPGHNSDITNIIFLNSLMNNGIEVIGLIK